MKSDLHNFLLWLDSGDPYRWIWSRSGAWSEQEFGRLLAELRTGPYWPLNEAEVRQTLDTATATYRDLERWGLLTPPAQEPPQDDEEIWF